MPMTIRECAARTDDGAFKIGKCTTRGGIDQPVVLSISKSTAEGRQPTLPHLVAEGRVRRKGGGAALLAAERGVAFNTQHQIAGLSIGACGHADDSTAEIDVGGSVGTNSLIA